MQKKLPTRRHKAAPVTHSDPSEARAAVLEWLADAELQHGHHVAAEHLAHRAAQLRDVAR